MARSTGVLAVTTAASRVLGFIRDVLLAGLFGTSAEIQAFVVAFRLPNLMRDLVAEGAVTSAFVPVLSSYRATRPPEEFWRLSHALATRLFVALCVLGLMGVLAAEPLVRLMAPGFVADPQKFALAVQLTRVLFPFLTLVGLWAYFMGVLNSLGHFAAPSLGPAMLNLAMIAACVWVAPRMSAAAGVTAVAWGVMAGGVVQLFVQLPVAARLGFHWRWRWRHPGSAEVLRLLGPRVLGGAVYQMNVFIHTALASWGMVVGEGAVAALYFANRLVQLPLAMFGSASAQASQPQLAEQWARGDRVGFRATLMTVLRMVGFVMLPSSVGLMALATPMVSALFERGAFDAQATLLTSGALVWYAAGLWAYAVGKVLTSAFYAMRDTTTPVRLAAEAVAVNVALSLVAMWPMGLRGLALSASLSTLLNAYRLVRGMERRLGMPLLEGLRAPWLRITVASAVMGMGCWSLWHARSSAAGEWGWLFTVVAAGIAGYGLLCRLLRVEELSTIHFAARNLLVTL